jgi:hypothetical protein
MKKLMITEEKQYQHASTQFYGAVWDCSMFQLHGGVGVYILN